MINFESDGQAPKASTGKRVSPNQAKVINTVEEVSRYFPQTSQRTSTTAFQTKGKAFQNSQKTFGAKVTHQGKSKTSQTYQKISTIVNQDRDSQKTSTIDLQNKDESGLGLKQKENLARQVFFHVEEKKPVNLLAKAVALLSRREYSEQELRRKLSKYTEDEVQIDAVIARLQKENWQSNQRFAENFVLFRQDRWGNQKILHALSQHHLDTETVATLKENLKETEFERAKAVWLRKFHGIIPQTPQEKAKQIRFLASRGFSSSVVYKVISYTEED